MAPERVDRQCHEPPPGTGRVGAGDMRHRGVGDQQEQEVFTDEVLPQLAGRLGPFDERDDLVVGCSAELLGVGLGLVVDGLTGRRQRESG